MENSTSFEKLARAGLAAKGIVYFILGILTLASVYNVMGAKTGDTDKQGVFTAVSDLPGGRLLLGIIAAGLVCYVLWRVIQAVADTAHKGNDGKGLAVRARYLVSGLAYATVAYSAMRMAISDEKGSGGRIRESVAELLSKPFGQWLVGILACVFLGVGIYQIYYALSEKYQKHVTGTSSEENRKLMLVAGKVGYVARGVVWALISWLLFKAAINSNSAEAGDTSKAFALVEKSDYGTMMLTVIAAGLILYGLFSILRAKNENLISTGANR